MTIFRNKLVFNTFHWSGEQMILHPGIFKTKLDFNFNYTCIHSYKTPIIKQHLITKVTKFHTTMKHRSKKFSINHFGTNLTRVNIDMNQNNH